MNAIRRTRSTARHPRRLIGILVVLGLLFAVVGGVSIYARSVSQALTSNLHRGAAMPSDGASRGSTEGSATPGAKGSGSATPGPTPGAKGSATPSPTPSAQTKADSGPLDFVLMGSDSRDPNDSGAGRSDTLMLVHLNADRSKAYLISFPRDMWVDIPGHGKAKINAAYAYGGTALTVQTLQNMLGITVDHLAVMDFAGLIALTDQLGGVTITNDYAFTSHGFTYPRGKITISGEEALQFVRERYALPRGDFDRAENQRKVVKEIIAKGLSPRVLSDPARFTAFVGALARNTTVDDGLTDDVIRRLVLSSRLTPSSIITLQAPVSGTGTSADGQSIDIVDQAQLAELAHALQTDSLEAYLSQHPAD